MNPSSFYSNLVNQHYNHQNQLTTQDTLMNTSFMANQSFTTPFLNNNVHRQHQNLECCDMSCNHRIELDNLRENIMKLLYGIMPQYLSMSGLDNSRNDLNKIDKMVDSLVQQINTN